MDEVKFWKLVQLAHKQSKGEMDRKCELITKQLTSLSKSDAIEFLTWFDTMRDRAYTWPLWGAAYVINGGCSDDAFSDFRASLVSRGREAFEKALANPESLADEEYDEETWFYEGYQYAVNDGIEAVLGSIPERSKPYPAEPSGQAWDEDKVYDLFPRLAAKFS